MYEQASPVYRNSLVNWNRFPCAIVSYTNLQQYVGNGLNCCKSLLWHLWPSCTTQTSFTKMFTQDQTDMNILFTNYLYCKNRKHWFTITVGYITKDETSRRGSGYWLMVRYHLCKRSHVAYIASNYTGSSLQRVPGYNKQISLHRNHWQQG